MSRYCEKCKGMLCSCGLFYTTSASASDQKPREFWIVEETDRYPAYPHDAYDKSPFDGSIHVIEKSAFDALAEKLKEAEAENKTLSERFVSKTEYDDLDIENEKLKAQNDRLKTELLNTKELSSKLVEENAGLEAEIERLKSELEIADLKTHKEQDLRILELLNQLTLERSITAMMREVLKKIEIESGSRPGHLANRALAKEVEMRK